MAKNDTKFFINGRKYSLESFIKKSYKNIYLEARNEHVLETLYMEGFMFYFIDCPHSSLITNQIKNGIFRPETSLTKLNNIPKTYAKHFSKLHKIMEVA